MSTEFNETDVKTALGCGKCEHDLFKVVKMKDKKKLLVCDDCGHICFEWKDE